MLIKTGGLRGEGDPALLELAARQDRILITHDRNTMTRHFSERLNSGKPTPGVFIVPQQESAIGEIIDSLLLVWMASEPEEMAESDCLSALPVNGESSPEKAGGCSFDLPDLVQHELPHLSEIRVEKPSMPISVSFAIS
jgi:hypothetical protein